MVMSLKVVQASSTTIDSSPYQQQVIDRPSIQTEVRPINQRCKVFFRSINFLSSPYCEADHDVYVVSSGVDQ